MQTTAAGLLAAECFQIAHASKAHANTDANRVTRAGVVQTVLGPVEASKLGFTLTHEHVGSGSERLFDSRARSVADAVDKLKEDLTQVWNANSGRHRPTFFCT
jgi:hypothetical protein